MIENLRARLFLSGRALGTRRLILLCAVLTTVSCTSKIHSDTNTSSIAITHKPSFVSDKSAVVLVGAGDIASCDDLAGAEATARLIDSIPGTVFALGDLAYTDGSDEQFAKCYGPTWGRFRDRTRPAPGNHEYHSDGASGYVRYFGAAVGDPKKAYYSYDLGAWHIIVLNSECNSVGGCGVGSQQERWLRQDLKFWIPSLNSGPIVRPDSGLLSSRLPQGSVNQDRSDQNECDTDD